MTFKCDATTRAELDAATTLEQQASVLAAALGTDRTIRCFRDANASAADASLTGTEFRRLKSTGTLQVVSGRIRRLGKLKTQTISLSADMSTGASELRIEGNGRVIQGSLGLSLEAQRKLGVAEANLKTYDFTVRGNFTTTNGFGVTANFAILGKEFMPSGVGPAVPALTANAPASFEVWDWADPASPTLVGALAFNKRVKNWVYEDPEMAAENGDVGVYQSTQSIVFGEIEFGGTLLVADKSNRADAATATEPLYQFLGSMKNIHPTWTTYPFADTYERLQVVTRPKTFKAVLKNAAGTVLHTFQMQDGLPINDPSLAQSFSNSTTNPKPLRPFLNCGMMLPWQNARPRKSGKANKYYAGLTANSMRPAQGKSYLSSIGVEPNITGGYDGNNKNGIANMHYAPRWPLPAGVAYWPTKQDPYVSYMDLNKDGGSVGWGGWSKGWDYEPGSYSLHNWYTGPGGPRHDRCFIPSVVAVWATDQNYQRLQDDTPIDDMFWGYALGGFNHSNHWMKDVKSLNLTTNQEILSGSMSFNRFYYSSGREDPRNPKAIDLVGDMRSGENDTHFDKEGRLVWNGWARDNLHNYKTHGWISLLANSPMHAIASKFDTTTSIMLHGPANRFNKYSYMVRDQAWEWLHLVIAWKNASDHPLGFNKAELEAHFLTLLDGIHRDVIVPTYVEREPGHHEASLRNLGVPTGYNEKYNFWGLLGTGLGFYMAGVLMLMKQTGLWSVLCKRNARAKEVLEMQLLHMDRYMINMILDTPMQFGTDPNVNDFTRVPANWPEVSTVYNARNGQEDYIRNPDGTIRNGSRDVNTFPPQQYLYMRGVYFPEIQNTETANGRLAAAVAKLDQYWADKIAYVDSTANLGERAGREFTFCYPGVAPFKGPTELGPA